MASQKRASETPGLASSLWRQQQPCGCLCEILGLREYTTFLSGTSANLSLSWQMAAALGLIHLLLYVGFILLVPIFLITAALITIWNKWIGS